MSQELLHLSDIQKYYGPMLVLDQLSLSLDRGDRAALVGENGAGKTTLARILTGQEQPDSGLIRLAPGLQIGYLPQDVTTDFDKTVWEVVAQSLGGLDQLRADMEALEQQLGANMGDLDDLLMQYGILQEEYQQRGGYELEDRLPRVFAGLRIDQIERDRRFGSLSGGEKTRVFLAALLLQSPDLLILDEPTNHLDFAGLEWLENYLADYPHALLLISHDRRFINRVANQVIELSPQTHALTVYHGDYEAYMRQRQQRYESALSAFEAQRDEMIRLKRLAKTKAHNPKAEPVPRDSDKFYIGFKRGRADVLQSKEIRDAKQRLAMLEENKLENPRRRWLIRYEFDPEPLTSAEPVRLKKVARFVGERCLFQGMDAVVQKGDRIVIIAPNGSGKTTLLRMILGQIEPDAGEISIAQSARLGYLDQEGETLNLEEGVLEMYRRSAAGTDKSLLSELHRSGLFTGDLPGEKRVGDLSVGQRRKLALASLIASRANVLLLDEPTNHLDLASIEALEEALLDFSGAIIAVSHDRWFIDKFAAQLWYLEAEGLRIVSAG